MASTYVNNLRLNEMATGDGAGTWGTTTNTNLELIGEALGYGTEAITTNADTHTSTVADGSADAARAMYLKYTGTLDSACTITIGPNTMKRVQFIENATTGSQNIIISQGSGANVTIPPGDVKVVYLDGAGSGAAVVDAFASLSVVDLKVQDDLTVTDDLIVNGDIDLEGNMDVNGTLETDALSLNGTTVTSTAAEINLLDGSSANTVVNSKAVIYGSGGEVAGTLSTAAQPNITSLGTLTGLTTTGDINLGDNDKAIFGAGSDLQIYHDGSNSILDEVGTGNLFIRGTNVNIQNQDADPNENMITAAADGAVTLFHDGTAKLATSSTGITVNGTVTSTGTSVFASLDISGDIDVDGTSNLDVVDIDGAVDMASTLTVASTVTTGRILYVKETGTDDATAQIGFGRTGNGNSYLDLKGDATNPYGARLIRTNGGVNASTFLQHAGTGDLTVRTNDAAAFSIQTNASERMRINSSGQVSIGTTTAEGGLLCLDTSGNNNRSIVIGRSATDDAAKSSALSILHYNNGSEEPVCLVGAGIDDDTDNTVRIGGGFSNLNSATILDFYTAANNDTTTGTVRMRIDSSGNVGIGTTSPSGKIQANAADSQVAVMAGGDVSDPLYPAFGFDGQIGSNGGRGAGMYLPADGTLAWSTAGSERMRIDSSGRVGIGCTPTDFATEIQATSGGNALKLRGRSASENAGWLAWTDNAGNTEAAMYATANNLIFANTTSYTERMRIDSSGRVGIAQDTPGDFNAAADDLVIGNSGGDFGMTIRTGTSSNGSIHFADGTSGDAENEGIITYDHSDDHMHFSTSATERMRIDGSGSVVIQDDAVYTTNAPTHRGSLILSGASGSTSFGGIEFHTNAGGGAGYGTKITASDAEQSFLRRNNSASWTETMRLDSDGTLCVGITGPLSSTETAASFRTDSAGAPALDVSKISGNTTSANVFIRFHASSGGTAMGAIAGNGSGNAQFIAVSDERLKENIQPLSGSLDKVLALNPVSYDWKKNGEHIEAGFVAQEVEEILPEYVTTEEDEKQTKGLTGGMTAGYIAVLTKAIQEQQTQIEALQSEINKLKGE